MENPPSTPFSVLQNDPNDRDFQEFVKFLRDLIKDGLGGETRILVNETWITVVENLSTHFLATFPSHEDASWDEIQEKVTLVGLTLEVIQRVAARVRGLFVQRSEITKATFSRLLNLCYVLDGWIDWHVLDEVEGLTPGNLRSHAFTATIALLESLGNYAGNSGNLGWKILKTMLLRCLEVCGDLMAPPISFTFPWALKFFEPSNAAQTTIEDASLAIIIEKASQLPLLFSLILNILAHVISKRLLCQPLMGDLERRIIEMNRMACDHFLSPTCSTTARNRAIALGRTLSSVATLYPVRGEVQGLLADIPFRLLQHRLAIGPGVDWEPCDIALRHVFDEIRSVPCTQDGYKPVVEILHVEAWGEVGQLLRRAAYSYLRGCFAVIGIEGLNDARASLLTLNKECDELVTLIDQRLALLSKTSQSPTSNDMSHNLSWGMKIRSLLAEIIHPHEVTWMDEDDVGPINESYALRVLDEIKHWSERAFNNSSYTSRQGLAEKLIVLTCLLSSCDNELHSTLPVEVMPFYEGIIRRLLSGPEEEATITVRRIVYTLLSRTLQHHSATVGIQNLGWAKEVIFNGLSDKDRSVRLSAGRAFTGLMLISASNDSSLTEPLFTQLHHLLESSKNSVRETALIAVGLTGKRASTELLGQCVCFLISQLGRQNILVKGVACLQFLDISKHHQRSPYSLVLPYMPQIAPFLVLRMCTQPSLLSETCRLISVTPIDLISTTLPRTLPQVFASCESKVLEVLAKELKAKPSSLFLNYSHDILSHIFLLPGSLPTNKALNFVLKVLTDATDKGDIDIQSVVKSCIVPLLADIIVSMGDHQKGNLAHGALAKVEQCISVQLRHKSQRPPYNPGSFLKGYMLGVISWINEMLQDVQGKKSLTSKQQILRSLGSLVCLIGPAISAVAPQIMATLQTMVSISELAEVTLESWYKFLVTLDLAEVGPHVGPTTATFVSCWSHFTPPGRQFARQVLEHILATAWGHLGAFTEDVVDLSPIPELWDFNDRLKRLRSKTSSDHRLERILERSSSDNVVVASQALSELKIFMAEEHPSLIRELASGDMFDLRIGRILSTLLHAACRDGDGSDSLRLLAFECIGILGAVDPDRCEIGIEDTKLIMLDNFTDDTESVNFALHLIQDLLVGAFRSTSDIKYQGHLAYSIQELLRFCKFTPALVSVNSNHSVPLKVRNRWNGLPKHVLETVTPLLEARFTLSLNKVPNIQCPIYPTQSTYREWIQLWTSHLITKASGQTARTIFGVFRSSVRNKDVSVAHYLLPHLVLNILVSGNEEDVNDIRSELLVVLQDQISPLTDSTPDKKLLSAQAVFMLFDHFNKWVRLVRQHISAKQSDGKRSRHHAYTNVEEQLTRVDSILSNIDLSLMAKAALQCKSYARALMSFERQIVNLRERSPRHSDLPLYYERLHEIYAHLDEPDGMEGVSTLILSPSLEHQIRQHESTGHWTSAQSCWEVRLQQQPDNLDLHVGLLRCLRNLGHYDTLRTHVTGVLTRNPDWSSALAGFQVESAWMVGAWDDVQRVVDTTEAETSPIVMARLLLSMRAGNQDAISNALTAARIILGAPITASGVKGYRRSYDAALDLHLTHELELICNAMKSLPVGSQGSSQARRRELLLQLSRTLSARLDSTLPTFRTREPILSMRRVAFALSAAPRRTLEVEVGKAWLASAKIARKAGQWQTAYSAMLQARQSKAHFAFIESAKLVKVTGEPLRALQELENSMKQQGIIDNPDVLDLTEDDDDTKRMKAKAEVLRARWMNESDRFDQSHIMKVFNNGTDVWPKWESGNFHLGQFHDESYKALSSADKANRGLKMNLYTVRFYAKAIKYGSKYVYQTVPRILTIWLDMGEDEKLSKTESFKKLNDTVARAIKETPVYKWYTAFPQIVSRVGHNNQEVLKLLAKLIITVLQEYPKQALWLFTSVVKSTKKTREQRGRQILDQVRNNPSNARTEIPMLVSESLNMTNELLALCDTRGEDETTRSFKMSKDFPSLFKLGRSPLIIPLQESLTASLPPASSSESHHQPFPPNAPTFHEFFDDIEIMKSMARPRKISILGSNGQVYTFLGKPKDDLRKDARLMDLYAIINKLLKANSESRRRQLHIRTYGVITLNEECGFIQWVPNTIPLRPVLLKHYDARRVKAWSAELGDSCKKIKVMTDLQAALEFKTVVLPMFPPVFHEWFVETFPEPSAWLASRLTYGRTAAVMSMVGFILGLGDRHCENILLDSNSGDVVHVDFNILFERGKTLETPERVPFRLTQNMVDGLGVTGVEGVYRIACEITMQLLRDNKDSLMNVLDAFIHDPLVEWEDEKRKRERHNVKSSVDLSALAKQSLGKIEKKLKGVYSAGHNKQEREMSTSNLVQMLIQEATDLANLAKMYPGWAPWH